MANDALSKAKSAKNDEFYTVYEYIQKEINRLVNLSLRQNPNSPQKGGRVASLQALLSLALLALPPVTDN